MILNSTRFYIVGCAVGSMVGFMSVCARYLAWWLALWMRDPSFGWLGPVATKVCYLLLTILFPVFACWLVMAFAPEAAGSGVPEIEGRLAGLLPLRWHRVLPVKFIGSIFSIAAKMVLGREGPTIQIGGAIGGMVSDSLKISGSQANTLVAAGAGAGLAAAFNAPLAGVLFVLEEMHERFQWDFRSAVLVVLACIASTTMVQCLIGQRPEIIMHHFDAPRLIDLGWFAIFGIILGFCGLFFNEAFMAFTGLLKRLNSHQRLVWCGFVGACVGLLALYHQSLAGGGYNIIREALTISMPLQVLFAILLTRLLLLLMCYSTNVPGGVFAPMLSLGTLLGVMFGKVIIVFANGDCLSVGMFAVAGMGGLFSAAIGAPLTGILLIVEMTQNYQLILPLMVTCLFSAAVADLAGSIALYPALLSRKFARAKTHI